MLGRIGCGIVAIWLVLAIPPRPAFSDDPKSPDAKPQETKEPAKEKESKDKESKNKEPREDELFDMLKIVADTFEQIDRNYVKEVDRKKLLEAAVRGMMDELDPYSNYISPEDLERFNATVDQEFGGIGIQVTIDTQTRRLTVMTPLPGTPAYKAGIRAGDTIMEIEGKSTEGVTLDQAVKQLKGQPGEAVTIGILHLGDNEVKQVTLTRAVIHVATVLGDTYKTDDSWNYMLDPEKKIGYIRLTGFSKDSARELRQALNDLTSQGMKALVLDLRFNPGGLLSAATEISDLFLTEGKIVSTKGRNTPERIWTAKRSDTFSGFPLAVLVNRFSASASEIVSAALQDHKRAVIIGERTWGKGSVQNVIELGKGALKLTTASYHRPSGKNIHRFPGAKEQDEWGVMPDEGYDVPLSTEETQKYLEYRRQKDVLAKEPTKSEFIDKQLAKALDYLNSQMGNTAKPAANADEKKPADKKAEGANARPGRRAKKDSKESTLQWDDLPFTPRAAA